MRYASVISIFLRSSDLFMVIKGVSGRTIGETEIHQALVQSVSHEIKNITIIIQLDLKLELNVGCPTSATFFGRSP